MSLISDKKYKAMDNLINEMNASVNVVGDYSIFLFNRFRNFVGYLFIIITTVALAFIGAEFVRGFEMTFFGIDLYYIVLFSLLIPGLYLAMFGEEAKIATIKGAVFSSGGNRTWQTGAALAIIAILMLINAKGTQKIADYSLRYMNTELQDSYLVKLKEQKMKAHVDTAQIKSNKIGDTAVKMLMMSRQSLVNAKNREIQAIQGATDNWISGRNPKAYRTIIAQKRVATAKQISQIEERYAKKLAKMDWKIQKAEDKVNERTESANKIKLAEMEKADSAAKELEDYYTGESGKNKSIVEKYKNVGLIIAISGEFIDGLLAFLLFMLVKSNPNVNGTPKVQENTRQEIKLKTYDTSNPRVVTNPSGGNLKFIKKTQKEYL